MFWVYCGEDGIDWGRFDGSGDGAGYVVVSGG